MPISLLLQHEAFEPEQIKLMTGAFEAVCHDLAIGGHAHPSRNLVAKAIIECAQSGEFNPVRLRECGCQALKV